MIKSVYLQLQLFKTCNFSYFKELQTQVTLLWNCVWQVAGKNQLRSSIATRDLSLLLDSSSLSSLFLSFLVSGFWITITAVLPPAMQAHQLPTRTRRTQWLSLQHPHSNAENCFIMIIVSYQVKKKQKKHSLAFSFSFHVPCGISREISLAGKRAFWCFWVV